MIDSCLEGCYARRQRVAAPGDGRRGRRGTLLAAEHFFEFPFCRCVFRYDVNETRGGDASQVNLALDVERRTLVFNKVKDEIVKTEEVVVVEEEEVKEEDEEVY